MKKQWENLHVEVLNMADLINEIQANADSSGGPGGGPGEGDCGIVRYQ